MVKKWVLFVLAFVFLFLLQGLGILHKWESPMYYGFAIFGLAFGYSLFFLSEIVDDSFIFSPFFPLAITLIFLVGHYVENYIYYKNILDLQGLKVDKKKYTEILLEMVKKNFMRTLKDYASTTFFVSFLLGWAILVYARGEDDRREKVEKGV